jgi:Mrp family chromosome partitioning ATPase
VLGSEKMKLALETLSTKFDMIIVDSPPCLVVTDAAVLSAQTDAVIVVARADQTRQEQLQKAVQRLQAINANVIGISLNGLRRAAAGYYYDTYADGYHESLSQQSGQQNGTQAKAGLRRVLRIGKRRRAGVADDR